MESLLESQSLATHLSCSKCGEYYSIDVPQSFSICCEQPLVTNYSFENGLKKSQLVGRVNSMWRYSEMLPISDLANKVTLGEGMTPILPLDRIRNKHGLKSLLVKDEGLNPTGSFKARGISVAISKAKELGISECVIPTAGNAGGALSAYCAASGIQATVVMPSHTPKAFQDECHMYDAKVILVDGLIDTCSEVAESIQIKTSSFNLSTLKEPYRLEGKKTMGYEIAEQLNWELPDVIVYPTGGGTGLIGIWKAFQEMIELGWIDKKLLPRMVVVQSQNCAPMVDFIQCRHYSKNYGESKANGLAVPKAFGKDLIKNIVLQSGGYAVAVSETQIIQSALELAKMEGISFAPEGGATWAGLQQLLAQNVIAKDEKVLLINTGSASKYMEHLIN